MIFFKIFIYLLSIKPKAILLIDKATRFDGHTKGVVVIGRDDLSLVGEDSQYIAQMIAELIISVSKDEFSLVIGEVFWVVDVVTSQPSSPVEIELLLFEF